jgi:hypothetical protein
MRTKIPLILGVATLLFGGLSTVPAQAYISTCGVNGNYFYGYYFNVVPGNTSYEGASTTLVNRFGSVCDTDHSGPNPSSPNTNFSNWTSAWVMITDGGVGGVCAAGDYAQSGIIRGYNTPQYIFAEFTNSSTCGPIDRYPSSPSLADGSTNSYSATWNGSCGCIQMKVDSTIITQTNYNPFLKWGGGSGCSSGGPCWSDQYLTEKSYQENDTMGTPTQPTKYSNMRAQRYVDNVLIARPCGLTAERSSARTTLQASSCQAFDVWRTS